MPETIAVQDLGTRNQFLQSQELVSYNTHIRPETQKPTTKSTGIRKLTQTHNPATVGTVVLGVGAALNRILELTDSRDRQGRRVGDMT